MLYRPVTLLALLALSVSLIGCAYVTGEAVTLPVSSPVTEEAVNTSASLPRWVWSSGDDGYSIIIDRQTHQKIRDVTPYEAFGIIGTSSNLGNPVVIDVRTPGEFADGYIWRNTLNIDFNSPGFREDIAKLDKNKTYLVYCRSGNRNTSAVNVMTELGFKNIHNMTGGITEWQAAGLPLYK